jgi:hypothetical protein
MRIPKTLKIGGRIYKITIPFVFTDAHRCLYGLHDPAKQTIKMTELDEFGVKRHQQSIDHTFLHEILHAIDNVYIGGKIGMYEDGEHIIDQLAEGLLQVIRDNKLFDPKK